MLRCHKQMMDAYFLKAPSMCDASHMRAGSVEFCVQPQGHGYISAKKAHRIGQVGSMQSGLDQHETVVLAVGQPHRSVLPEGADQGKVAADVYTHDGSNHQPSNVLLNSPPCVMYKLSVVTLLCAMDRFMHKYGCNGGISYKQVDDKLVAELRQAGCLHRTNNAA